jgi:hypothetical protein
VSTLALVSAKGAPGVTTTALLLAAVWPTPSVLLEADWAGGDLRSWLTDEHGRPLRGDLGVVSLLAAHHRTGALADRDLHGHAQTLAGGLPVLIGPGSPAQAEALRGQWPQLAAALGAHPGDVLLDVGRVTGPSTEQLLLLRTARLLVVCRATTASLSHTRDLLTRLTGTGLQPQVLLLGSPTERDDISRALQATVHQLPLDPSAATALTTGQWNRRLDRSPLLAAARRLATTLHELVHLPHTATSGSAANMRRPDAAGPSAAAVIRPGPAEAALR